MRFLARSGSWAQAGDAAVGRWLGEVVVVVGFGVVKRKTRWRFQVGSDVVLMPCLCDGGDGEEWSGGEGSSEECEVLLSRSSVCVYVGMAEKRRECSSAAVQDGCVKQQL